jgi:hypothetical protein
MIRFYMNFYGFLCIIKANQEMTQDDKIITLHRYFIWANRMRTHFDSLLLKDKTKVDSKLSIELFMYMSYWYAGLYVVIEAWRDLELTDTRIDELLKSPNVDLLRIYRNATFHYQEEYEDKKFRAFMEKGMAAVMWIRSLNSEFGSYFLKEVKRINAK